ncbi:MAG TPA: glycosyltransferase [Methylomirabilota bacterium]|nr:glycosyltransferase [Methylomirabilota bacterium]
MSGAPVLELVVSTQPGGGPQHVLALATWLRARGWQPVVAGPHDGALFERFAQGGVEIVRAATDRLRPATFLRLARLVRARGVRLIHSHGKGAGLYGRLVARALRVPAIHTFHGIHFERYGRTGRAAYLALERRLSRWTAVVVNVSRAQQAEGLALRLFTPAQSRVVVNGVDAARLAATALDRWDARAALGLPTAAAVVGCAARFDAVKRLDVLLRAAAAVPDPALRVVLIGRGAEEGALRALAASLELGPRAVFPGEVTDAARLFPAFDLYVTPSAKEGLPLAVLEAMAVGAPVLASDIPAHREVLGPASPGLVAPTPQAFTATLRALLADPEARRALGAEQRTRVRSEFDARQMLAAVEAIYGQVVTLV